jgi:hypothetical protein
VVVLVRFSLELVIELSTGGVGGSGVAQEVSFQRFEHGIIQTGIKGR